MFGTKKQFQRRRRLQLIARKITRFDGRQWCGYLTPMEIIELVCSGIAHEYIPHEYSRACEKRDRGESNPTWFYFRIGHNFSLDEMARG
jgi:hypothetical protein